MKKIAFDTSPLVSGHSSRGMGVYTKRLLESLEEEFKEQKKLKLVPVVFSANKEKLAKFNLVHYTSFDLFYHTLPLVKPTKTIVTVPDVIPLIYPKHYPPGIRGKINFFLQKISLKSVDAVITISETSKKDIVNYLGVKSEKVFVTKLAANFTVKKSSSNLIRKVRQKYNLPDSFILYIGDVNWNKNLLRLIKAVKKINKTLVIVGKSAVNENYDREHIENAPLREIQEKYGCDKQIMRLGFVDDEDLNVIWQLASVYCMPSLYEGFGLPVVEAMNARVPVACSDTPALKEIAGDAALYFNPMKVDDIANKLLQLLKSRPLQKKLIEEGVKQSRKYSWFKTAKKTLEVYNYVLSRR